VAERNVHGFVVSPDRLRRLVGSGLDAEALMTGVSDRFVAMFDEQFDGQLGLVDCVAEVLHGRLEEIHAYAYARVVEPLLTMVAEPMVTERRGQIFMIDTYSLPNDDFGCWNPVLQALGLDHLAALWALDNCAFPWPPHSPVTAGWPCITALAVPDLTRIRGELDSDWRPRLAALPDDILADDGDQDEAQDSRDELTDGLNKLQKWVQRALRPADSPRRCVDPTGNTLVLVMDGSQ
jgi:hypothetical protein